MSFDCGFLSGLSAAITFGAVLTVKRLGRWGGPAQDLLPNTPVPFEGPATKSGLRNPPIENILIGLSCGADQCGLAKETRQLQPPVGKKVQWPGVLVFENFSEVIMISEHARIRILTLRVRWK